jgi:hypothetical protein
MLVVIWAVCSDIGNGWGTARAQVHCVVARWHCLQKIELQKELLVKEIRLNKKIILDSPNDAGCHLGHLLCIHSLAVLLGWVVCKCWWWWWMHGMEPGVELFVVMGVILEMVPILFLGVQTWPHGLCAAIGYVSTHEMTAFPPGLSHCA